MQRVGVGTSGAGWEKQIARRESVDIKKLGERISWGCAEQAGVECGIGQGWIFTTPIAVALSVPLEWAG